MKNNIPLKNFSDYFFENISIGSTNQIQITSACNGDCIFCSNKQNPFIIKRCSFRSIEEIEKIVYATENINGPIYLNESLPGRISEGEAFLHPEFFTILKIIRTKFGNTINITTNASLLKPDFIKRMKDCNPIEIAISFPTINKEHWKETFRLGDDDYYTALNSFSLLSSNNIGVTANFTPMPAWLGWEEIEETLSFLSKNVRHILVYAPGYTSTSEIKDKLIYDKMELSLFLEEMSKKYSFTYTWNLDPRKALAVSYDLITNNIWYSYKSLNCRNFLWLTSTAAKDRFEELLYKLSLGTPINNTVIEVKNIIYGGNIECSGLWLIQDIHYALEDYLSKNDSPDQIFMPKGFLDKYGFDLQGENIIELFKKYNNLRVGLLG